MDISFDITDMNAVCPVFFKLIAMMEQYHPRTALYWELTRYLTFLGNMYVLVISLLNKINQSKTNFSSVPSFENVVNQTLTNIPTGTVNTTVGSLCWETAVGQELFKLIIIDLVALVFSVINGDLIVSLVVRFLNCFQGRLLDLQTIGAITKMYGPH
ncbi:transmembrane channel-like protein 1 [Acropora millepora]|uniref:transmembrane channel-like protein 1 n=1 Tax=Acropora millepora TaxID=45264 RepID=UPI001CF4E203|nr:transmembrane channel-like protein 1 [Acropora millepora]